MVEAGNLLFQPVSLHLAGDGREFLMGPRERMQRFLGDPSKTKFR
jgi:hypothetical protein